MSKAFVLILLLWSAERSETVTAEYSSEANCKAALAAAYEEFHGYNTKVYGVCSEK